MIDYSNINGLMSIPHILMADDDSALRETMTDILESSGYTVTTTSRGDEALRIVKEASFDVILLDINMPEKNGLEITEILKNDESTTHIPIIIVTGETDTQLRLKALKLGADDFLEKPPHYTELIARIRNLVKVKAYNDCMRNDNKILEEKVNQRTKQLQETLYNLKMTSLDTIFRLSRAAEYKDEDTSTHLHRMCNYAAAIAKSLAYNDEYVETLLYTTSLHDIGKIGIPDNILLKPGKLDDHEWDLMKKHTLIGADILENSPSIFLQRGREIALTHHEKWDGSGYPNGLVGADIPLEGRITAVADVFDALTTNRPYKKAFETDKAFKIIAEGRGKHFDPDIVDSFFSIKNEILEIKNNYSGNKLDTKYAYVAASFN